MNLFKGNLMLVILNRFNICYFLLCIAFIFLILSNSVVYSQDNMPDFPYDPEEKATQAKICAKVCLKRRDVCLKIEKNNSESEQMCQSRMIVCINQCR